MIIYLFAVFESTSFSVCRLVIQGYKGLKEKDLIPLNPRDTTAENVPIFQSHLRKELEKNKAGLKETLYAHIEGLCLVMFIYFTD